MYPQGLDLCLVIPAEGGTPDISSANESSDARLGLEPRFHYVTLCLDLSPWSCHRNAGISPVKELRSTHDQQSGSPSRSLLPSLFRLLRAAIGLKKPQRPAHLLLLSFQGVFSSDAVPEGCCVCFLIIHICLIHSVFPSRNSATLMAFLYLHWIQGQKMICEILCLHSFSVMADTSDSFYSPNATGRQQKSWEFFE